jgi:hypothetical protein
MSGNILTETDDEACGPMWAVYLNEAQQYDEPLVKSWKEDMDVTLVFVSCEHLFSLL